MDRIGKLERAKKRLSPAEIRTLFADLAEPFVPGLNAVREGMAGNYGTAAVSGLLDVGGPIGKGIGLATPALMGVVGKSPRSLLFPEYGQITRYPKPLPSMAATAADAVPKFQAKREDIGDGYFEIVISKNNKPVGLVAGRDVGGGVEINIAEMAPEHRGKGYVADTYATLASQGKPLVSDASVSESAARVYDALKKRGFAVERNPLAKLESRVGTDVKYWSTPDKSPVFRVTK